MDISQAQPLLRLLQHRIVLSGKVQALVGACKEGSYGSCTGKYSLRSNFGR